jgi:RimJ/RimL family protein N-acetyltransferase
MEASPAPVLDPADAHLESHLAIRPVRPEDRDGLTSLFARLSAESRRLRYLSPKPRLSERELTFFSDVDHVRHEALVVVDIDDGAIVAVARYVETTDRAAEAEIAVEVADDLQRRGLGLMVARAIIERARENEFVALTATLLWENRAARALAQRLGFMARGSRGSEIALQLALGPAC